MAVSLMTYTTILAADTLRAHLDDTEWVILDCRFNGIADAATLDTAINAISGVVGHGLFVDMSQILLLVLLLLINNYL